MNQGGTLQKIYGSHIKRQKFDVMQLIGKLAYEDLHNYLFGKHKSSSTINAGATVNGSNSNQPSPTNQQHGYPTPNPKEALPPTVRFCTSGITGAGCGIQASQVISEGAWIGPYKGRVVKPDDDLSSFDSSDLWEIFKDGKLSCYIDGNDKSSTSWMRFIRCARQKQEQNLYAFQYKEKIYYRAFKAINPGQELLVWYDDMYAQYLGIPCEGIYDMASSKDSPNFPGNLLVVGQEERFPTPPTSPRNSSSDIIQQVPPLKSTTTDIAPLDCQNSKAIIRERLQRKRCVSSSKDSVSKELSASPTALRLPPPLVSNAEFPSQKFQRSSIQTNHVTPQFSQVMSNPSGPPLPELVRSVHQIQQFSLTDDVTRSSLLKRRHPSEYSPSEYSNQEGPQDAMQANNVHQIPNATDSESSLPSPSREAVVSPTSPVVNEQSNSLECGQCKKTFPQRGLLQTHVCSSKTTMPYQCGHCDERFTSPGKMTVHVAVHQDKKPFKCGYCCRSFSGATTLNNHVRMHTGERLYDCYMCGKSFSKGLQLSKHQKTPGLCVPCI